MVSRFVRVALLLVLMAWVLPCGWGAAQTLTNTWVVDTDVTAVTTLNNTVYIGGPFTSVGPVHRRTRQFHGAGGHTDQRVPGQSRRIHLLDDSGWGRWPLPRWRLPGPWWCTRLRACTRAGQRDGRSGLQRRPLGSRLNAMALVGNTLYVGGNFFAIGGAFRNGIAALDARTGRALPWEPEYRPHRRRKWHRSPGDRRHWLDRLCRLLTSPTWATRSRRSMASWPSMHRLATCSRGVPRLDTRGFAHSLLLSGSTLYVAGTSARLAGRTATRSRRSMQRQVPCCRSTPIPPTRFPRMTSMGWRSAARRCTSAAISRRSVERPLWQPRR